MGVLLFAHFAGGSLLRTRPRTPLPPGRAPRPCGGRIRARAAAARQTHAPAERAALALPAEPAAGPAAEARRAAGATGASRRAQRARRLLLLCAAAAVGALARLHPALAGAAAATSAGGIAGAGALVEPAGFISGLTASFALVLASEIGDKTFFISALLSMKYSRVLVLVGTMLALGAMTVISVGIGQLFHAVPATLKLALPIDDYAAIALLLWFGVQNIRDGFATRNEDGEELEGAREVVAGRNTEKKSGVRVVTETSSLVFFAEWGDKSMLATVALAAAKSPVGVIVGGVSGHLIATIIAVVGGSILGRYISEKNARLVGGVLFLVFAVLTFIGIY